MVDALLDQAIRRLHVHNLGRAGIADAADTADEQHRVGVDLEFRIVDRGVVMLGALKDDRAGFVDVLPAGVAEEPLLEVLRDDRRLHHGAVKQVALHHDEARIRAHRLVIGLDDLGIFGLTTREVLAHRLAGDGHDVLADMPGLHQLAHHGRHAARAVEAFAEEFPGGLHVDQKRMLVAVVLEVLNGQLDTHVTGNRDHMRRGVGRTTNRGIRNNRVDESVARHDLRGAEALLDHLNDPAAGVIGHLHPLAERRGDCGAPRERHAERFRDRVHRRGRAHRVAVAERRRRGANAVHEFVVVDGAFGQQATRFPDNRAGPGELALPVAVEHRAA